MSITASSISTLRNRTGAGLLACKKALEAAQGNIEEAIIAMRKTGQIQAAKKADRVTAEGIIKVQVTPDGKHAIILEVNSETDFVARDQTFQDFTQHLAQVALDHQVQDLSQLAQLAFKEGQTVEQIRQELVSKTGENIQIRRLQFMETTHQLGHYVHMNRRGCLVELEGGDAELAKAVAVHIVANNPLALSPQEVPLELVEKEREVANAQAQATGKSAEVIEKMVAGRINKFLNESSLLGQSFIKEPGLTVAQYLERAQAKLIRFVCFIVGEGIEKKTVDFAQEIKNQLADSAN